MVVSLGSWCLLVIRCGGLRIIFLVVGYGRSFLWSSKSIDGVEGWLSGFVNIPLDACLLGSETR